MTETPASLLERLRQPFEPEAWGRFVALYTPLIFSWGRRVGLQETDAADLVQEVFVTLLQVLPTFTYDRHQSFRRWLRTITLNKWRNDRKRWDNRMVRGHGSELDGVAEADGLEALWEAEYQQHLAGQAWCHAGRLSGDDLEGLLGNGRGRSAGGGSGRRAGPHRRSRLRRQVPRAGSTSARAARDAGLKRRGNLELISYPPFRVRFGSRALYV